MLRRSHSIALAIAALTAMGCHNQRHTRALSECRAELSETKGALAEAETRQREAEKSRVQAQQLATSFQSVATQLRDAFTAGELDLELQHGVMVMTLNDDILFALGETTISPQGEDALWAAARALKSISESDSPIMLVLGHTDSIPVKPGTREYASNIELSAKRSLAVHGYLVSQGVPAKILGVAGMGEMLPVAPNDTASGRAQNRRIEIIVLPTIDALPTLPAAVE